MSNKLADASPVEESKRWGLLCKVYAKALSNWELLLTQPVQNVDTFKKAFRAMLAKHPEAIEVATSGGMLQYVMKREFPTLASEAPESFDVLIKDVVAGFKSAAQAEFTDFFRDLNLEAKLVELESREAALRAGGGDKDVDRPEALTLQPEEEIRTVVVESLLSHEAQLTQELERVSEGGSFVNLLAFFCAHKAYSFHTRYAQHTATTPLLLPASSR
jgi:hypothetical protein